MTISRRQFNSSVLATTALIILKDAQLSAQATSLISKERIALNRLTFGAVEKDEFFVKENGLAAWLDRELSKPLLDEAFNQRLRNATLLIEYEADKDEFGHAWDAVKEARRYVNLDRPDAELLPLLNFKEYGMAFEERLRPAREVQAASLMRAVHADNQLREVMTQFWHDHFNVNATKDERTAAYFPFHDRVMRRNALENFRVFLGEVTRSPPMLFYLNNEASKASPANENFARELFELHTLGAENYTNDKYDSWGDVPGADSGMAETYIDEDVYEAARALTGWSFGDGRYIAEGENAPYNGEFNYQDSWHDPYQKRILGQEFAPNGGPMQDGNRLLDIVASHPGTARFVCRKIVRRLFQDEPDEGLVESAALLFLAQKDAPDQIGQVVRHIALSHLFAETKPQKLKRPFEFLASLYRMSGSEVMSPELNFMWSLSQCGWTQHECRPPTGHADRNEHWANTNYLTGLTNIALNAFEDWSEAGKLAPADGLPDTLSKTKDAAAHLIQRLISPDAAVILANELAAQLDGDTEALLPVDKEEQNQKLRTFIAMAAFHPEFLYR